MKTFTLFILIVLSLSSCSNNENPVQPLLTETMYFPPNIGSEWETVSLSSLGWNQNAVQALKDFLLQTHTKSFIIIINGRIVMEEYFNGHSAIESWEWNSSGKTLVATAIGIAQEEGFLNINNKVSDYLGIEWTNMPLEKEKLINVSHLLTMTSGIDDTKQWVIKSNLTYVADASTRWAYGNVFQKLMDVISNSTNKTFETFFNEK